MPLLCTSKEAGSFKREMHRETKDAPVKSGMVLTLERIWQPSISEA